MLIIISVLSPVLQKLYSVAAFCGRRNASTSTDLRAVLEEKIPKEQERVKQFRKEYGNTKVGEVTVDMVSRRER